MEKRYKLLKDLPDVKVGAIFELVGGGYQPHKYINYETEQYYNPDVLKNNPNWFAPYLFTTDDGVEIFGNDNYLDVYYEVTLSNKISKIGNYRYERKASNTYFSTKEAAEEYLKSLTPRFKVGDIIIDTFQNRNRIGIVDNIEKLSFERPYVTCKDQNVPYLIEHCRLATDEEIIEYEEQIVENYKKQGWVEGAKFKHPHLRYAISMDRVSHCLRMNKTYVYSSEGLPRSYDMDDCELVKEPQYPKSWGELHLKGFQLGKLEYLTATHFDTPKVKVLDDYLIWSTKSQAKSALAFAQLTQLHAATIAEYNRVNGVDWKPDYTNGGVKWTVSRNINQLKVAGWYSFYTPLPFPTKDLAEFALDNWKELWEQYYEL